MQKYRHGKIIRTIYDDNVYEKVDDTTCKVYLCNKIGDTVAYTLIDTENVELCKKYKWSLRKAPHTNYAETHIKTEGKDNKVGMHRVIMGLGVDGVIDHINHDGLDNRKANLRVADKSLNAVNSYKKYSGIRQVPSGKYQCEIQYHGTNVYLGTFDTKEEALTARTKKLNELYNL